MPSKSNPLGLNNLQLKTLVLFQELARHPETSSRKEDTGEVLISNIPNPHGNHFHLGAAIVSGRDATGLRNPAVWAALERKGLAKAAFPMAITLTPAGIAYDVGPAKGILHGSDH
jgi:hypothetical protein